MFRFVIVKVKWRRCLSIPLARKDGNNKASTRFIALASPPRRRSVSHVMRGTAASLWW